MRFFFLPVRFFIMTPQARRVKESDAVAEEP